MAWLLDSDRPIYTQIPSLEVSTITFRSKNYTVPFLDALK